MGSRQRASIPRPAVYETVECTNPYKFERRSRRRASIPRPAVPSARASSPAHTKLPLCRAELRRRKSPRILRWLSRLRHEEPLDQGASLHDAGPSETRTPRSLAGSHGGRPSFDTREVWTEWGPDLPTIESRSIPIFGLRPVRTTRFKGGDSPPSCQRPSPGLNASWRDDQIAYFSSERPLAGRSDRPTSREISGSKIAHWV